jgi:predicted amidohydrolase YtcJ
MKQTFLSALLFASALYGCSTFNEKQKADLIICNAIVYTIDSTFATAESFAVKDGKILAVGKQEDIFSAYEGEKLDLQGKAVYPGLIDAHCHFLGYGKGLTQADLIDTKSFDEVIQRVVEYSKIKKGEWIIGRGWDQNDWIVKDFPTKEKLDSLFPTTPVFLKRVDGHAALVNSEALKRAGINEKTKLNGGLIEVKNNKPTGILVDNAVDLVANVIPPANKEEIQSALLAAQANCFAAGLTTVDDAGLEKQVVDIIDEMQKKGELKMRIYAMLTDNRENLNYYLEHGKYKSDRLNICSFKFYADGALGSRGACLLHPYSDKPKEQGFLLNKPEYFIEKSKQLFEKGFQMNTHCIGDSSDRFILDTYGAVLKEKNNKRWRIEHAQVVDKADINKFHEYSIIPSVQSTHATSDMYWAKDRLGEERIRNAYAYKDLLVQAGTVALGTDFPVENINPLYTFYAAVARKDLKGFPEQGFQPENALTREEALKGMTIWAAYSNFEEKEKGSLEAGKWADFIITDKDIMKVDINEVPNVKILATYLNGEKVH